MRCLAAALALAALAPVAAAASLPLAAPEVVPLPDAPALPLPAVALAVAPVPVTVAVDPADARAVLHADLPELPVLDAPDVRLAVTPHPRPVHETSLSALADRRAERAFAPPARAPPADPAPRVLPDAPAAAPPTLSTAAGPDPAAPPADEPEVAFATAAPVGRWTRAAAMAGLLLLLLAPLALYHRLRGARTLEQPTRARLFDLLRERPGLTPADAARALDVDPKTAHYHLVRLAKEGLAVAEGPARQVRYFAAGTVAPQERGALVAAAASREVLDAVLRSPGRTKTELADALGVARPTVNWHLRRLAQAGLVRCERDGRGVRVLPLISSLPKALNSQAR